MIEVLFSRKTVRSLVTSLLSLVALAPLCAEDLRPVAFQAGPEALFEARRDRGPGSDPDQPVRDFGMPHIGQVGATVQILPSVQITDHGRVIYEGPYDVNPTLRRIREGRKLANHDGSVFKNREGKLPPSQDASFYLEFRIKEDGLPFPGAQRVVINKDGVVYFTGDHYRSFHTVEPEKPPHP